MSNPNVDAIRERYNALAPVMDERLERLWAAAEALALGHGGVAAVTAATGILAKRIIAGKRDLDELRFSPPTERPRLQRIRRPGGGRKPITVSDPSIVDHLDALVSPEARGDPQSPLRWTCKSTRKLAEE